MEWRWGNEHRLTWALDQVTDPEVLDDLLDGLSAVAEDPYGPMSSRMRGLLGTDDRYIAALPHMWFLVYTPRPDGVPPESAPILVVRDFRRLP